MTQFLDANVLLRYLTRDPLAQALQAAELIHSDVELTLAVHILAEVAYVLTTVYRRERHAVVDVLIELLQRENISLLGVSTETGIEALEFCRPSGRVNFADALLWALARSTSPSRVWSFDRRFPHQGIELREPGTAAP
jgi:predicted nucleic-acid-binding protein